MEDWRSVRELVSLVARRDGCTARHSERVTALGVLLAAEVVPAEAPDPEMRAGFLLHDVGKLGVPDGILHKSGPLGRTELLVMQAHPRTGEQMLAALGYPARTLEIVRHHHERWDGRGYPDGMAGGEIPLWARIFAIADAVDAMTSERPYRAAGTLEDAVVELWAQGGQQFDPACVEAFVRLDRSHVEALLERPLYGAAARSVASKSVRGIGPTHGDVVPAWR
jgi:HD-GYP domain-containing protein (c-di-GMP phosphodiesterase class II)